MQAQIVSIHENEDKVAAENTRHVLELQDQLAKATAELSDQVKTVLEQRMQLQRKTAKEEQAKALVQKYVASIDCLTQQLQLAKDERERLMTAYSQLTIKRCL